MSNPGRSFLTILIGALAAGPVLAQTTTRASVNSAGVQGDSHSSSPALSADGRYVAFMSVAQNFVPNDTNAYVEIFVHDSQTGATERINVSSSGGQGFGPSMYPAISSDGRFVAFESTDAALVLNDTNLASDIFVRDRQLGTTVRVSVDSAGAEGNMDSEQASLSGDGRFVIFNSYAMNLVAGDTNSAVDAFVHDRLAGTTERVSIATGGAQANGASWGGSLSADGRFATFASYASNLVAGDSNGSQDVFLRDRMTGTTTLVSVDSSGNLANSGSSSPAISAEGRFVAFTSLASNLVAGDTNATFDVFVHDGLTGLTERVSVDSAGQQAGAQSDYSRISADGRCVAFESLSSNLVAGDTNGWRDVFLRDRLSGTTERASVGWSGQQATSECLMPSLSADGRCIGFAGMSANLVPNDTNAASDAFVRNRGPAPAGTDLCQPGSAGVRSCPCSNPPANSPRGCENSSATGGAQLTSNGASSIAGDTLHFVTNGECPTATSILLQGSAELPGGVAFGQGVRCAGGALRRLYVLAAVGGSISAPGQGDPSVSARSAALGDVLGPVSVRWYAVYYRDATVLGGCPATSNFNSTQTQRVLWTP